MVVMAMLFALILKKPRNDDDEIGKEIVMTQAPALLKLDHRSSYITQRAQVYAPPPRVQLATDRERRLRAKQLSETLKEIVFYTTFLVVIFCTVYSMHDDVSFKQSTVFDDHFFKGNWKYDPRNGPARLEEVVIHFNYLCVSHFLSTLSHKK